MGQNQHTIRFRSSPLYLSILTDFRDKFSGAWVGRGLFKARLFQGVGTVFWQTKREPCPGAREGPTPVICFREISGSRGPKGFVPLGRIG